MPDAGNFFSREIIHRFTTDSLPEVCRWLNSECYLGLLISPDEEVSCEGYSRLPKPTDIKDVVKRIRGIGSWVPKESGVVLSQQLIFNLPISTPVWGFGIYSDLKGDLCHVKAAFEIPEYSSSGQLVLEGVGIWVTKS
jgi:hypothetical protein